MTVLNRIERLQEAHPWMEETDIHAMLVAKYFMLTRMEGLEGVELHAAMEEFTNETKIMSEEKLRRAIDVANRFYPE